MTYGVALDLTRCHFQRRVQDIDVFGTWHFGETAVPMPCLALLHATRSPGIKPIPVVVRQSDAWIWSPDIGHPGLAAKRSMAYADVLGLNTADLGQPYRISRLIADLLPDLLSIPPLPRSELIVVAEAQATDEHGRSTEAQIFDYN